MGDKTYPSIKKGNEQFLEVVHPFQPNVTIIQLNKKHVSMVTQYFWSWSNHFDEVIDFIERNSK